MCGYYCNNENRQQLLLLLPLAITLAAAFTFHISTHQKISVKYFHLSDTFAQLCRAPTVAGSTDSRQRAAGSGQLIAVWRLPAAAARAARNACLFAIRGA